MTAADVYIELGCLLATEFLPAPESVDLFPYEGQIYVTLDFAEGETHNVDAWAEWAGVDIAPASAEPTSNGRKGRNRRLFRFYRFEGGKLGGHPLKVSTFVDVTPAVTA